MRRFAIAALLSCLLAACGDSYGDDAPPSRTPSPTTSPPAPTHTIAASPTASSTLNPSASAVPATAPATPPVSPSPPAAATSVAGEPTPVLRTTLVHLGDRVITVEVADEPSERTQGLSGRDALARDGGMLFVWDQPAEYTLWMKDMRIPLDFVWLDASKRVIKITANVPHQPGAIDAELVRYTSGSGALYAIELNAGAAAGLGIEVGDVLVFDERP